MEEYIETKVNDEIEVREIKKCPVALVDIDHTLVYSVKGGKAKLNKKLLQALEAKGIKDLYLFTDMMISAASLEDRLNLINKLTKRGFVVHGVITPLDYFWGFDQEILKQLDEAIFRARIIMREEASRNLEKIEEVLPKFPAVFERVDSKDYPKFGQAFAEAEKSYSIQNDNQKKEVITKLSERSVWCKAAIDAISYLRKLPSCKAIMMLQFLVNLPAWVLSIKVLDDRKENIESVKVAKELLSTQIPIEAYLGEFNERGETFAIQIAPELFLLPMPVQAVLPQNNGDEAGRRVIDIATKLQKEFKELQTTEFFGTLRFKKEFGQAQKFFSIIMDSSAHFESIWECVLDHLKTIPANRAGGYQLSGFDQKLLEALFSDTIICDKICTLGDHSKMPDLAKAMADAKFQVFIQMILGKVKPKEQGVLSQSMGSIQPLKLVRNSSLGGATKKKPASVEPSSQGALLGIMRKRSLTADSAPNLDYLKPSSSQPVAPNVSKNESPDSSQESGDTPEKTSGLSQSNIK